MGKLWRRRGGALMMLICLGMAGCGGCGAGSLARVEVRGKVAYHGMPLHGGMIVFTPDAARGTSGPLAVADIQPDGSYVLQTDEQPGAVAGWHRVTVIAVEPAPPPPQGVRFNYPLPVIPEKYRDPDLSGLCREVKASEMNVIDFDLE
jgi:hypothetical protein